MWVKIEKWGGPVISPGNCVAQLIDQLMEYAKTYNEQGRSRLNGLRPQIVRLLKIFTIGINWELERRWRKWVDVFPDHRVQCGRPLRYAVFAITVNSGEHKEAVKGQLGLG